MGHEVTDAISLELGRCVAERLQQQPALIRIAHNNLDRWMRRNAAVPSLMRCYEEWRHILNRPVAEICQILTAEDDEARRLRQNSPFVGILSPREVWELKRRFHDAPTAT